MSSEIHVGATERLLAIEDIRRLKARYLRALDSKDWKAFGDVFTSNCTFAVSRTPDDVDPPTRVGRIVIVDSVKKTIGSATTRHEGFTPEIRVGAMDAATGIWAMTDRAEWTIDGRPALFEGAGHYHETYERRDGRWLISTLRLTRLWTRRQ